MNINEIVTKADIASICNQLAEIKSLLNDKNKDKEVLRSSEVKSLLGISDSTLQRLRISGELPANKVNGTWFYILNDVMSKIQGHGR